MIIRNVALPKKRLAYLADRGLTKQFQKAVMLLCHGYVTTVQLKRRQPTQDGIYYVRINRQYRAWCKLDGTSLIVFHIDDHQG